MKLSNPPLKLLMLVVIITTFCGRDSSISQLVVEQSATSFCLYPHVIAEEEFPPIYFLYAMYNLTDSYHSPPPPSPFF